MTNGEMIKALFPNVGTNFSNVIDLGMWWDAEFKGVDVLDKIRAEIDSHCSDNRDRNDGLYIAMKIIDRYRNEVNHESNN